MSRGSIFGSIAGSSGTATLAPSRMILLTGSGVAMAMFPPSLLATLWCTCLEPLSSLRSWCHCMLSFLILVYYDAIVSDFGFGTS